MLPCIIASGESMIDVEVMFCHIILAGSSPDDSQYSDTLRPDTVLMLGLILVILGRPRQITNTIMITCFKPRENQSGSGKTGPARAVPMSMNITM